MRRRAVAAWVGLAAALGLGVILPWWAQALARARGQGQPPGGLQPPPARAAMEPTVTRHIEASPPGEHLVSARDAEGQDTVADRHQASTLPYPPVPSRTLPIPPPERAPEATDGPDPSLMGPPVPPQLPVPSKVLPGAPPEGDQGRSPAPIAPDAPS
jgi:hypothetical protein